ncbi:hypothetical protein [Vibrio ishigakensis]|uniref:hypothetical protein n=1 Tax=Vibrio ishigakensis TaxID=1481914 RepID=UPI0021C4C6D8|nr:hypothetical protein [Vibrio ishigakensis]
MLKKSLLGLFIFVTISSVYLFWLPVKILANSVVQSDALTENIMAEIREELISQPSFLDKLENHRGEAKRYLHRTPMTAYTTLELGLYDVYATYINDDKEWVVRLGIYPDRNAEIFFPMQVGGVVGFAIGNAMYVINNLIEAGILKPMLYHITDKPETSFVSSEYQSVPRLVK